MKLRHLLLLLLMLVLQAMPAAATEASIVGTWELVQVDGVHPRDVPPWGYRNLIVDFGSNGLARFWFVGEESQKGASPYAINDGAFRGWLGLSNDPETPRPIRFFDSDWFEIRLPEGFVAAFRRVEEVSRIPDRCVYFTVAGETFDAAAAARSRRIRRELRPGDIPPALIGSWTADVENETEGSWRLVLVISGDSITLSVSSLDYPEIPVNETTAAVATSSEYLWSDALACGAPHAYRFSGESLVLSQPGGEELIFQRVP
ncbi:MAG: hypothetical protein KY459_16025 [Acidobacteria bacterium]|nr:hypothetical protein [Acidobacteriota bacterium]